MSKFFFILFLLLSWLNCFAFVPEQIIFFGDSLSDNGNLYRLLLGVIPRSPPYFEGRFSNGLTWAENFGKHYYDKYYVGYKVYAYGGATAVLHAPTDKFIAPTTLENEINQYLIDSVFKNKSKILYVIWIGGNDYLFAPISPLFDSKEILTKKVVNKITWAMETLIANGAKYFLILNMPDLSHTPFAKINDMVDKLHDLSLLHNQKLDVAIYNFKQTYPQLKFFYIDIYHVFNDVITNPAKFNETYHVNITDVSHACWEGGYTFGEPESYRVGLAYHQGLLPCNNADEHIFWDQIHPTRIVHYILSEYVFDNVRF
ncbi:MAG: hypothetical protein A3F42_08100 [Gammaproteobacteria bacterium RIFCSPHIGHO2_12_FULL_37_34]|nr:MAG: hypothetical protein A3F42_08100 [Gammaproteobacteria bacterium RIFCSPHIGHO2_12_FULL_37_34]